MGDRLDQVGAVDFLLEPLQLDRLLGGQIDAASQLQLAAGGLPVHAGQFSFGCSPGSGGVGVDASIGLRVGAGPGRWSQMRENDNSPYPSYRVARLDIHGGVSAPVGEGQAMASYYVW